MDGRFASDVVLLVDRKASRRALIVDVKAGFASARREWVAWWFFVDSLL